MFLNPKKNAGLFYLQNIFLIRFMQAPIAIFQQYILSNPVTTATLSARTLSMNEKV